MPPRQATKYGSIIAEKDETQQLLPAFSEDVIPQATKTKAGPCLCMGVCILVVVTGLVLFPLNLYGNPSSSGERSRYGYDWGGQVPPLSIQSPEIELGLRGVHRAKDASPSSIWGSKANQGPLPTNSWYLNLVSHRASEPDEQTRAYTVPYIIDTAADHQIAGIRVHWPVIQANQNNIQMVSDFKNGISLGTLQLRKSARKYHVDPNLPLSDLAVSLRWDSDYEKDKHFNDDDGEEDGKAYMQTSIVRGMPFATMKYVGGLLPTLFSYNAPATSPVIDNGTNTVQCGVFSPDDGLSNTTAVIAEKEIKLHFINSDFTWIVFFSQPVELECGISEGDIKVAQFQMNIKKIEDAKAPLVVRVALVDQCTTGESNIKEHCKEKIEMNDRDGYVAALRNTSHLFPTSPKVDFEYPEDDDNSEDLSSNILFDWMADSSNSQRTDYENLMMFALPHHQEQLADDESVVITDYCTPTFHGRTCLVRANTWSLPEKITNPQSFTARRPPEASAIPALAEALSKDILYRTPGNLQRGAADTYFSGKILARIARVILIADELTQLAMLEGGKPTTALPYDDIDEEELTASIHAAASAKLPSKRTIQAAVNRLKQAVQVWLENPGAPYVYDRSWGGLVNCGCRYTAMDDTGFCNNTFPDCPALSDVNEDFGNGYYNDHHFHYGYHVYAAAVAAKFDPEWGKAHFQEILLYIRDYANPSKNDSYFPRFRQKDWYLGSSWAAGIVSAENSPHGRNQESSSEAIAAYEGVALYGRVMTEIMKSSSEAKSSKDDIRSATLIRNAGELLTVTELEAASRYWHVWSSETHKSTYPAAYKEPVVGMMYDTMASFQTWFAPYPLVSYGIQLMPFTPVGEQRDDPDWASLLYPMYKESCESVGEFCVKNGWTIIQSGLCATAGMREEAIEQALAIPSKVFASEGGMGNSLTNTLWYIATRKQS